MSQGRAIQGLGEIALRVSDLDTMQEFYERIVGLEVMRRFPDYVFFRIAAGIAGHTQVLALFDRSARPDYQGLDAARTTIDHIAFGIALEDYQSELERIRGLGVEAITKTHAWTQWRSIFVKDPEGNTVELVCYDPSVDPE